MTELPLISIIVPVYNVQSYVAECLESLIDQTYTNIEIICVNDGSEDNSLQVLRDFQNKDSRISIINKCNEGVSKARNVALEVAHGDLLMFVDADDWLELNCCEIVFKVFIRENADVIMWPYIKEFKGNSVKKNVFNEEKLVFDKNDIKKIHRRFIGVINEELRTPENADALCTVWGKVYKSKLIFDNKISFINLDEIGTYEDGMFNLSVFGHVNKAVYINAYLYHYRKNNCQSITSLYKEKLYQQWQCLFHKMRVYINENHLTEDYNLALDNRITLSILGLGLNILSADICVSHKVRLIFDIIENDYYRQAFKKLEFKYLPIHWKVFYACAKYRFAWAVYFFLFIIARIIE